MNTKMAKHKHKRCEKPKDQSPMQELEVSPCSGLYLLVIEKAEEENNK